MTPHARLVPPSSEANSKRKTLAESSDAPRTPRKPFLPPRLKHLGSLSDKTGRMFSF